jgi:hypothetical protein
VAANISAKPYKALGIDLAERIRHGHDAAVNRFIQSDLRIQRQQADGRDHAAELAQWQHDMIVSRAVASQIVQLDAAVARNGEAIDGFRDSLVESLKSLKDFLPRELAALAARLRQARQIKPESAPEISVRPRM